MIDFFILVIRRSIFLISFFRFFTIFLMCLIFSQHSYAQGDRKAAINYYWGCQYLIRSPIPSTSEEREQSDKCQGAIANVLNFNKELPSNMAFCPPLMSSGVIDTARIIVVFMKNNTMRLAERFDMMAYSALRTAWPCS
jgi:Rap1a immunity proteins